MQLKATLVQLTERGGLHEFRLSVENTIKFRVVLVDFLVVGAQLFAHFKMHTRVSLKTVVGMNA